MFNEYRLIIGLKENQLHRSRERNVLISSSPTAFYISPLAILARGGLIALDAIEAAPIACSYNLAAITVRMVFLGR